MSQTGGQERLLSPSQGGCDHSMQRTIFYNFLRMAFAFALNLSTVTTVVAFAGSDFARLGDYSNGILYGTYCCSALFAGAPIIYGLGIP
jgi:hypothetical protein